MNIEEYIKSGVIESYVLGLATDDEVAEVDTLRKQYPQVNAAIQEFSEELEKQAFANAVQPPTHVKEKIFNQLKEESASAAAVPPFTTLRSDGDGFSKPLAPVRSIWKRLAVAAIILLVCSAALNYVLFDKYSRKDEAYQDLLAQRETMTASNQVLQAEVREWRLSAEMMGKSSMLQIKMNPMPGMEGNAATVFWNTTNKDVYVMVNKLPSASPNKQYQLWAIVDGKPVDAGMIDPDCHWVCKMKNIPKAQAFAITLEKSGGNPVPQGSMYVMGKV